MQDPWRHRTLLTTPGARGPYSQLLRAVTHNSWSMALQPNEFLASHRTSAHHSPRLAPRPMGRQPGANPAGNRVPGLELGFFGVYTMCGNYGKKSIHQWRCLVYMLIGVYDMRGNYGKKRIHQSPLVNQPISRNTAARLLVGERVPGSSGDTKRRPHLPLHMCQT